MIRLITIIMAVSLCATSASAEDSYGPVTLRNLHKADFASNGAADIENCTISGYLSVNGAANISHSHIHNASINGSLVAAGIESHLMQVMGSTSISHKSYIDELQSTGSMVLEDTRVDKVTAVGRVHIKNSNIKRLDASSLELMLDSADIDEVFISHDDINHKTIMIKISGKSKIDHLTIKAKASAKGKPVAIIILDPETRKSFDKSKVNASGAVEYR